MFNCIRFLWHERVRTFGYATKECVNLFSFYGVHIEASVLCRCERGTCGGAVYEEIPSKWVIEAHVWTVCAHLISSNVPYCIISGFIDTRRSNYNFQFTRIVNFLFSLSVFRFVSDCRCNPYGSLSRSCDKHSGQCLCRGNVTGRTCDKCNDGFWDLQVTRGCISCECNAIGSRDTNCSQYTGQCNCKVGVGGLACDSCIDGFYGFSTQGCKSKYILSSSLSLALIQLTPSRYRMRRMRQFGIQLWSGVGTVCVSSVE